MSDERSLPVFLIDPPSPFAPMSELISFRDEALAMLVKYPGHSQWLDELDRVNDDIQWRSANPLPGDTEQEI